MRWAKLLGPGIGICHFIDSEQLEALASAAPPATALGMWRLLLSRRATSCDEHPLSISARISDSHVVSIDKRLLSEVCPRCIYDILSSK